MSNLEELGPIFHCLRHMFPVCQIMSGVLALKYSTAGVDGDEINKTSVGIAKAGEDGDAVHVYGFALAKTEEDGYEQGWIRGYPSRMRVSRGRI